jgi:hypothetical protein
MLTFQIASYATTLAVFTGLIACLAWRREFLLRPSFIFLAFFWTQVQFASAINAEYVYSRLQSPWTYFGLVQLFPLIVLCALPFTFAATSRAAYAKIGAATTSMSAATLLKQYSALLVIIYAVLAAYLWYVPFTKTGFYALLATPRLSDEYRELSFKLVDHPILAYAFTIMEKVLAPIAAALMAILMMHFWKRRRYGAVLLSVIGIAAVAFPTMIYGARGPAVMVVAAATFALLVANVRRSLLAGAAAAFVVTLLPALLVMLLKSASFAPQTIAYQLANVVDRVAGRTYCDNVSHIAYVQENGFHGIAGLEKIARLVGVPPVDILNTVGKEHYEHCRSFGFTFLQAWQDPVAAPPQVDTDTLRKSLQDDLNKVVARQQAAIAAGASAKTLDDIVRMRTDIELKLRKLDEELAQRRKAEQEIAEKKLELKVELRETVSAGAAFVVLNYTMFGLWSLALSFGFLLAIDLLLWSYLRMTNVLALAAVGASVVPISALSFSQLTTVLASKGLLLVPFVCWLIGALPGLIDGLVNWRRPAHKPAGRTDPARIRIS